MEKWIHFRSHCCQNYGLYQNIIQIKVVENWILYNKVSRHTCLSLPRVELGVRKIDVSNIILYWNGKVDSLQGSALPKIRITSKNTSNESFWAINFIQKSQWSHMFVSTGSGARGSKDWYVSNVILYWNGLSHFCA